MKKVVISLLCVAALVFCVSCEKTIKQDESKRPIFEGADLSGAFEIERDIVSGKTILTVTHSGSWRVYAGVSIANIDFTNIVLEGTQAGEFELPVDINKRYFYQLVTPKARAIFSERDLPMEGGDNFRDIGGYVGFEGRHVKWGTMLRTDAMDALSTRDLDYLNSVPVFTVVDFRSDEEKVEAEDIFPKSVINKYSNPIGSSVVDPEESGNEQLPEMTAESARKLMKRMYGDLVSEESMVESYRSLFEILQKDGRTPIIFHCTDGVDRTGVASMLILSALGVDKTIIMSDYMRSNGRLGSSSAAIVETNPNYAPFFVASKEYLDAAYAKIDEVYGSMDIYLAETLGVEIQEFRGRYLY